MSRFLPSKLKTLKRISALAGVVSLSLFVITFSDFGRVVLVDISSSTPVSTPADTTVSVPPVETVAVAPADTAVVAATETVVAAPVESVAPIETPAPVVSSTPPVVETTVGCTPPKTETVVAPVAVVAPTVPAETAVIVPSVPIETTPAVDTIPAVTPPVETPAPVVSSTPPVVETTVGCTPPKTETVVAPVVAATVSAPVTPAAVETPPIVEVPIIKIPSNIPFVDLNVHKTSPENDIIIDSNASQSCNVASFNIEVQRGHSQAIPLLLQGATKDNYSVKIGDVPQGVLLTFMANGLREITGVSFDNLMISADVAQDAQKGSFNVPIIYGILSNGTVSNTMCQLHLEIP